MRWLLALLVGYLSRSCMIITILASLAYPAATLNKIRLLYLTLTFLIFSKDKTWETPRNDPAGAIIMANSGVLKTSKRIIFIRHGESLWNSTFNKGERSLLEFMIGYVPFMIYSFATEWYLFVTGHSTESWFFDSPLSQKGINQARDLRDHLDSIANGKHNASEEEKHLVRIMLGIQDSSKSVIVSSNLRRAIATCAIVFQRRLEQNRDHDDDIVVMSDLQEASVNPDSLCITPSGTEIQPSFADRSVKEADLEGFFRSRFETKKYHRGNKALNSNGLIRMEQFASTIFRDSPQKDYILVTGHSLWFRCFFQTYLSYDVEHIAKKKKIRNGGVVSFTLNQIYTGGKERFWIDEDSISVFYNGFGQ